MILCRIQKILGANGAEDYKDIAENQLVNDQRARERYPVKARQDESLWLVAKRLILCRIQKILGANGAEDFKDVTENQLVSDQQKRDPVCVRQDESLWLVTKCLILCRIQKILGANGAEDYKDMAENQLVNNQRERGTRSVSGRTKVYGWSLNA